MVRMFRNKMIQAARMGKVSILVMKTPVTSKCPFAEVRLKTQASPAALSAVAKTDEKLRVVSEIL